MASVFIGQSQCRIAYPSFFFRFWFPFFLWRLFCWSASSLFIYIFLVRLQISHCWLVGRLFRTHDIIDGVIDFFIGTFSGRSFRLCWDGTIFYPFYLSCKQNKPLFLKFTAPWLFLSAVILIVISVCAIFLFVCRFVFVPFLVRNIFAMHVFTLFPFFFRPFGINEGGQCSVACVLYCDA